MLSKNANIRGEWQRVSLTKDEMNVIMEDLIKNNIKELRRCIETTKKLTSLETFGIPTDNIIRMLYEKQATQSFTIMSTALEKKIDDLKNPFNPLNKEEEKPEEPKVEKPSPKDYSDSLISRALERKTEENESKTSEN